MDEAHGMLKITIFMIARKQVIAFWELSPACALACTPRHYDAYCLPSENPSFSRNSAATCPLLSLKSKTPFPQHLPLQIPQLPTKCPYPISATSDFLNYLRAQIPQLPPDHNSQSPLLQLLAPNPLGHQHSHHISAITFPTSPQLPRLPQTP